MSTPRHDPCCREPLESARARAEQVDAEGCRYRILLSHQMAQNLLAARGDPQQTDLQSEGWNILRASARQRSRDRKKGATVRCRRIKPAWIQVRIDGGVRRTERIDQNDRSSQAHVRQTSFFF